MSFYIEKIIVSGPGKTESIIELSDGLNIIYGPSNTGKTYIVKCIDYMFGSDKEPIDASAGYKNIVIVVKTPYGTITMNRKIGDSKISVVSTDKNIVSGKYSTNTSRKNYDKTINYVWLSLIGIKDMHLINKNEYFKKQILSWRTFCHIFMLTETRIISENSVLLSDRYSNNTAVISSLIFLLTNKDFAEIEVKDSKEIKDAKKDAIKTYINKELFRLSERNQKLITQIKDYSDVDINKEIEEIMSGISEYEQKLNNAIEESSIILKDLHKNNESLSECNVLLSRYIELETQYAADIKRLSFIIDGEINSKDSYMSQCPFCDGKVNVNKNHNYINAAKAEYKKIKLQAKDLEKASNALRLEKEELEQENQLLMSKKNSTYELIETEIKPNLSVLKDKLLTYKNIVEYKKEMEILKELSEQKVADIIENESNDESELKFKVKEHLDYNFIRDLSDDIEKLLEKCKYKNLLSVVFDTANMDIVINGKKKAANGKGYNAYLNSVVSIVLSRYMNSKAYYSPGFLVLDSPILSLKEKGTKKPSESMKHALFENVKKNPVGIQTIIIENEIPDIDYKKVNIIHFTKEKDNGRYGFLLDVVD